MGQILLAVIEGFLGAYGFYKAFIDKKTRDKDEAWLYSSVGAMWGIMAVDEWRRCKRERIDVRVIDAGSF